MNGELCTYTIEIQLPVNLPEMLSFRIEETEAQDRVDCMEIFIDRFSEVMAQRHCQPVLRARCSGCDGYASVERFTNEYGAWEQRVRLDCPCQLARRGAAA